ncbi:MAG: hypothetical protein ACOZNI_28495 [Myxococcota bacterium]
MILLLLGCVYDDGSFSECMLQTSYDCERVAWAATERPGAAFELVAGAGVGDMSVHLTLAANNPSATEDCLVAVYAGEEEPDPDALAPLDAAAGAPDRLGDARRIDQANLAHEWGTDTADGVARWDTGWDVGRDPDDLYVSLSWVLTHRQVHTWVTLATCGTVPIEGEVLAWAEYDFAVVQDPLYRFRLDRTF